MNFEKFIEEEKQYIGNLQTLDLDFITTILKSNSLDSIEEVLHFGKVVKDLIKLNTRFLSDLKKIEKVNTKPSNFLLACHLLALLQDPNLRIYHRYLLLVPKLKTFFTNESINNLEFHKILNTLNISFDNLDLFMLLELPTERLQKYNKMVKDFCRTASKEDFEVLKYYTGQIESAILFIQPLVDKDKVKISDPVLLGDPLLKHTSYLVEYKDIQIRKRFNDFENLLLELMEEFPKKTFPPFPEKNFLNRFNKNVVEKRIETLNSFFNELCKDVEIETSDVFVCFFRAKCEWDFEGTLLYSVLSPSQVEGGTLKLKEDKLFIYSTRDKLPCKVIDLTGSKVKEISSLEKKIITTDFGLPFEYGFQIVSIDKTIWFCYPKDEEDLIWVKKLKEFAKTEILSKDQVLSLDIKNKIYDEKVVQNLDEDITSEKYQSFE